MLAKQPVLSKTLEGGRVELGEGFTLPARVWMTFPVRQVDRQSVGRRHGVQIALGASTNCVRGPSPTPHPVAAYRPLGGALEGFRCGASASCASREPRAVDVQHRMGQLGYDRATVRNDPLLGVISLPPQRTRSFTRAAGFSPLRACNVRVPTVTAATSCLPEGGIPGPLAVLKALLFPRALTLRFRFWNDLLDQLEGIRERGRNRGINWPGHWLN